LGEQFPLRLMQLGFRLMQVIDSIGRDLYQYVVPPVCEVPAGIFAMGSNKQHDAKARENEIPQHQIFVQAFQIGVYPVTVAEYACAVHAGAVDEPPLAGGVSWQRQQQCPDHPVVCISWFQAIAYAMWLAQITQQSWRLPTEAEWEKAARGTDGRIYPWGNHWNGTRANTNNSEPRTTTPVGYYADNQDASPYGAHDMAGNVWEWTSTIYRQRRFRYPYRADDGRENDANATFARVLRGGSWSRIPEYARVAYRINPKPGNLDNNMGFRLTRGGVSK